MRPSRRPIVIATRRSPLALAQANAVARALQQIHPNVDVDLLPIESRGDQLRDHPLADNGGKGLFTTTIEAALLRKQADVAVHSMKDLPVADTAGLVIAAVPQRGDARDCLVSAAGYGVDSLPQGARVGTSSPRRAAQLLRVRGDLQIVPIRGNVETRVAKAVEQNEVDASVLAVAGLIRAGLAEHAKHPIDEQTSVPAASQAALAIQCRADDHVTLRRCLPLNDANTAACVEAERTVVGALGADCHAAIGVYATLREDANMHIVSRVLSHDGQRCVEAEATASSRKAKQAIASVIEQLVTGGGEALLTEHRRSPSDRFDPRPSI